MILRHLILIALIALAFSGPKASAEKPSCALFGKSYSGKIKRRDLNSYLALSFREGGNALDPDWIKIVKPILEVDPKKFRSFLPKELIDAKKDHEGNEFDYPNPLIRKFADGFLVSTTKGNRNPISSPKLFHMTSAESAELILKSQKMYLSNTTKNHAAICLGDGGFPAYKKDLGDSVILAVDIKPDARTLDLTYTYGGQPGPYSRWKAYQWYLSEFVPDLLAGKYKTQFPGLTAAVKKLKRHTADLELSKIEAFGLLMGADLIKLTEQYSSLVDEYWIIDPSIISEISIARKPNVN